MMCDYCDEDEAMYLMNKTYFCKNFGCIKKFLEDNVEELEDEDICDGCGKPLGNLIEKDHKCY